MNKISQHRAFGEKPESMSERRISVFLDFDSDAYENWRRIKLAGLASDGENSLCPIVIDDPLLLARPALEAIVQSMEVRGFAIYRLGSSAQTLPIRKLLGMCVQLGLTRIDRNRCAYEDGVTRLQTDQRGERQHYIPYTNKGLNWHTDGYYNESEHRIRAFALHCVQNADTGGESFLFDPELLYLLMRDEDPSLVKALFRTDALTIPENSVNACNLRATQSGPVFWIDQISGGLHMRYTARTRSIIWDPDQTVRRAVAFIRETLQNSPYVQKYKLNAGEGVISNNCLHGRQAFEDVEGDRRLLLRARYFDRISVPGVSKTWHTRIRSPVLC